MNGDRICKQGFINFASRLQQRGFILTLVIFTIKKLNSDMMAGCCHSLFDSSDLQAIHESINIKLIAVEVVAASRHLSFFLLAATTVSVHRVLVSINWSLSGVLRIADNLSDKCFSLLHQQLVTNCKVVCLETCYYFDNFRPPLPPKIVSDC